MAVDDTFTLPDQPATGSTRYIPLGGDGWSNPHSMYEITVSLIGDATGGQNVILVNMDGRWECTVIVADGVISANLSRTLVFEIRANGGAFSRGIIDTKQGGAGIGVASSQYSPPPLFDVQSIALRGQNIDMETNILNVWIYNFRKGAKNRVPMNSLLASIPRASAIAGEFT